MRIFQVITLADLGGAQAVVINLSKRAIEDGHEVYVISEFEGPMWRVLPKGVRQIRVKELQRSINIFKDIKTIWKLRKLYGKYRPDVIHLHSSKIGILGRVAFPVTKIIYTVHGFDSIRLANKKYLPIEKLLAKRAQYIIGVCNYDLYNLNKVGINNNTCVVYNGIIDWWKLRCDEKTDEVVSEENLSSLKGRKNEDDFIVLCIARMVPQKRFDLFCEIAEKLSDQKIRFFWIGNQTMPSIVPSNVTCLGEINNAYQYLEYIDLFLLPSNYEGMPVSIIEALLYGKPVLASDVGGIKEILNSENGFALMNDSNDFVEKILMYMNNPNTYKTACVKARETYLKYFTIETMYQEYMELYKRIIN